MPSAPSREAKSCSSSLKFKSVQKRVWTQLLVRARRTLMFVCLPAGSTLKTEKSSQDRVSRFARPPRRVRAWSRRWHCLQQARCRWKARFLELLSSVKLSAFSASAAQWKIERIKESWGGGPSLRVLVFSAPGTNFEKEKTPSSGVSQ